MGEKNLTSSESHAKSLFYLPSDDELSYEHTQCTSFYTDIRNGQIELGMATHKGQCLLHFQLEHLLPTSRNNLPIS